MAYNWQLADWPMFQYDLLACHKDLLVYAETTGRVRGTFDHLSPDLQQEAVLHLLVAEALKTSAIEGELLSREDVMSSIENKLFPGESRRQIQDERATGIAELMVDARKTYPHVLDETVLFRWHQMLLKGASPKLQVGCFRTHVETMQVVSGHYGKRIIHFEAPPSKQVPTAMKQFFQWFNDSESTKSSAPMPSPVRAAVAHLYFESIHPFEDGNGRIGRAVAEKALSQGLGRPALISLSETIDAHKRDYYDALEAAQRSNEITGWIKYFVSMTLEAELSAQKLISFTLAKAKFFDQHRNKLNERQDKVIERMLREGPVGFKGGIQAGEYMRIAHCSKATATRDLAELRDLNVLIQLVEGGRSTRYELTGALSGPV